MLIKCICTNCAGHLEFDDDNVGTTINCPHCGFDTKLFDRDIPSADAQAGESPRKRRRIPLWIIKLAALVLVLAGIGYALYEWGQSLVEPFLPNGVGTPVTIVALALVCLGFLWLIVWTLFPVLLFFELRKITELLARPKRDPSEEPEAEEGSEE